MYRQTLTVQTQDQTRVRYGISRVNAPDWDEESKALHAIIAQYPGMPAFAA